MSNNKNNKNNKNNNNKNNNNNNNKNQRRSMSTETNSDVVLCPCGHVLQLNPQRSGYLCDGDCNQFDLPNIERYTCLICPRHNLCGRCYDDKKNGQTSPKNSRSFSTSVIEIPLTSLLSTTATAAPAPSLATAAPAPAPAPFNTNQTNLATEPPQPLQTNQTNQTNQNDQNDQTNQTNNINLSLNERLNEIRRVENELRNIRENLTTRFLETNQNHNLQLNNQIPQNLNSEEELNFDYIFEDNYAQIVHKILNKNIEEKKSIKQRLENNKQIINKRIQDKLKEIEIYARRRQEVKSLLMDQKKILEGAQKIINEAKINIERMTGKILAARQDLSTMLIEKVGYSEEKCEATLRECEVDPNLEGRDSLIIDYSKQIKNQRDERIKIEQAEKTINELKIEDLEKEEQDLEAQLKVLETTQDKLTKDLSIIDQKVDRTNQRIEELNDENFRRNIHNAIEWAINESFGTFEQLDYNTIGQIIILYKLHNNNNNNNNNNKKKNNNI